jgi:hypothetical protein
VEQGDPRRAALRGGGVDVVDAPQELGAAVAQRHPEQWAAIVGVGKQQFAYSPTVHKPSLAGR